MANVSLSSSFFQVPEEERAFCTWVRVLLNFGFGSTIVLIGLIGNLIAYVVLNRGVRTAPVATFLLRCLALTDNFFLLVCFTNFSVRDLFRFVGYNSLAWHYVYLYSYPTLYVHCSVCHYLADTGHWSCPIYWSLQTIYCPSDLFL